MPLHEHFLFSVSCLLLTAVICHVFYIPSNVLLSISCKSANQTLKLVKTVCKGKKKDVE